MGMAADAPYAGKWKMNTAKSDFGESTLTYEQTPGGEYKATMDGMSFTFKTDGKDVQTPWGMTMAVKAVDATTWEAAQKANGKQVATTTIKLGADGKTLAVTNKQLKPDGGTATDTMNFERVSGGPGFAGKWKAKKFNSNSPDVLTLTAKGGDGLTVDLGNEGASCDAKFDGKDYPAKGAMWPAGWTCAIKKNGDRGFDLMWKKDGKDMYRSTLLVSGDGKTLTETGSAAAVSEKYKVVYDRQ
jgi:hypothetical protein